MKGDFSQWKFNPGKNDAGVLHQQGRVLLDQDWNAQTQIIGHWQDRTARETFGADVAAVPARDPDSFMVSSAKVQNIAENPTVLVGVEPGEIWADGIYANLDESVERHATYLGSPIQSPEQDGSSIEEGTRDAVILEIYREAISAFQEPEDYFEPALGGVDTTERMRTSFRFRLFRLEEGQDCKSLQGELQPSEDEIGRLSVSLEPATVIAGDCPVVGGGGYTGFEHHLFRVEIARTSSSDAHFKWSPFNGGLVGRGQFDDSGATNKVILTANRNAIVNAGVLDFYLEALKFNTETGTWEIVYGAEVTRNANDELEVTTPHLGTFPAGGPRFFRLWHGIEEISSFIVTAPANELIDGIQLAFDDPATRHYEPGDFWTFAVRAGEIENPETLLFEAHPQGVAYHRVPLAVIEWGESFDNTSRDGKISDCRRRFRPLTARGCCTFHVGDGQCSFGDFNSLELALAHLPAEGGELCLLPGDHRANLVIHDRKNIVVHGCGIHTRIIPREATKADPVFTISDSNNITIRDLDIAHLDGTAIVASGSEWESTKELRFERLRVLACVSAIQLIRVIDATIRDCRLSVIDRNKGKAVLDLRAEVLLVEDNVITVVPPGVVPPPPTSDGEDEVPDDPNDECADSDQFYLQLAILWGFAESVWAAFGWLLGVVLPPKQPFKALGGIHLRGGCASVRIFDNFVRGGSSFGITLGGILLSNSEREEGGTIPEAPDTASDLPPLAINVQTFLQATVINEQGASVSGVQITFKGKSNVFHGTSDAGGKFALQLPQDEYTLGSSAGFEILEADMTDGGDFGAGSLIVARIRVRKLVPADTAPDEDAVLLRVLRIERNAVIGMGLSGIGFSRFAVSNRGSFSENAVNGNIANYAGNFMDPAQLTSTSNYVRDLVISDNYISACFLNPLTESLRPVLEDIGFGGITLGVCDLVSITGNRITGNSPTADKPVTGIYFGFGDDIEVAHNTIEENGSISDAGEANLNSGIRGGIYVRFAGTPLAQLVQGGADRRPALRVTNNRVDQPVGRAFTALAFGPVECSRNYFHSALRGKRIEDQLVGSVLILNVGGFHLWKYYTALEALSKKLNLQLQTKIPMDTAAGTGIPGGFTGSKASADLSDFVEAMERLPLGQVAFQDNIIEKGAANKAVLSEFIFTFDDLAFQDNQNACIDIEGSLANAAIFAHTLRAHGNRFTELAPIVAYSLFSASFSFNQTNLNQGDHCIIATSSSPGALSDSGNQVRFGTICPLLDRGQQGNPTTTFLTLLILAYINSTTNLDKPAEDEAADVKLQDNFLNNAADLSQVKVYEARGQLNLAKHGAVAYFGYRYPSTENAEVVQLKKEIAADALAQSTLLDQAQASPVLPVDQSNDLRTITGVIKIEGQRGIAGLTVSVVNASGNPIGTSAATDNNGRYAIAVDTKTWETFAESGDLKLNVVNTAAKETLKVESPNFNVSIDDEIVLKNAEVRLIRPPLIPRDPADSDDEDKDDKDKDRDDTERDRDDTERDRDDTDDKEDTDAGLVRDPNARAIKELMRVEGIGEKRAKTLVNAGVKSIRELVELPDKKLARILPGINVKEIKEQARKLLKQQ